MVNYELMLILKGSLPEERVKEILGKTKEKIEKEKGEVEKIDEWPKRKLAYKIKQEEEGYYSVWNIKTEAGNLKKLEKEFRIKEDVLRYLIIRLDRKRR